VSVLRALIGSLFHKFGSFMDCLCTLQFCSRVDLYRLSARTRDLSLQTNRLYRLWGSYSIANRCFSPRIYRLRRKLSNDLYLAPSVGKLGPALMHSYMASLPLPKSLVWRIYHLLIGNLRDDASLLNLLKLHTDSEKSDEQSNQLG